VSSFNVCQGGIFIFNFDSYLFAERLKFLRLKKKLTLEQLGNEVGATKSTIGNFENSRKKPSVDLLLSFAYFFDVSVDYLIGRTDDDTPVSCVSDYENNFRRILRTLLPQIDVDTLEFFYINIGELERIASSTGHISLDRVCKIASLLGLSLDSITGYSNTNPIVKFDFQKKIPPE